MADRNNDEYKNVKFYAENTTAKTSGFSKFEVGEDYYFCRYIDGDIAMLSQAYTTAAGRDNGIASVKKNEKLVKRYIFEARGSKHGFALKAGNGQEIAISPDYTSQSAAEHVSGRLTGKTKAKNATTKKPVTKKPAVKKAPAKAKAKATKSAKTAATTAAFTASDGRIENYKPLAFYETNGGKKEGFNLFEEDGAHYFHYIQDGETVLISESYTSKSGRDNGVASVKKNMPRKGAYQHHKHKNGKHYFDINAANHQEIATSRWYASEAKALGAAAVLRGETPKSRSGNVEQNYMPLAFYKKATEGKEDGFETFKGKDGEHYFTYFENGKIALISEGYPTAAVRDKGMASVEKNMPIEKRYVYGKGADGKDGFILRAGNNKEIARSVGYGSAAAAAAGAAYLLGTRKRAKPAAPVVSASPKAAAPIATAAVGTAAVAGAAAIAAAAKPEPVTAAPVTTSTPVAATSAPSPVSGEEAGVWGWLKWLLLGLISLLAALFLFKACAGDADDARTSAAATTTKAASPAAMVTCWNETKAKTEAACPAKVSCWDDSFATSEAACPVQPAVKDFDCWDGSKAVDAAGCPAEPVTTSSNANSVVGVAGANASNLTTTDAVPAGTTVTAKPPKLSVGNTTSGGTTAKMTAPSIVGRICGPSANVLFDVSAPSPKNVTYLGSNPQFGNSLTDTPYEFFSRLQVQYRSTPQDKSFLDLMAKSLGYTTFGDMDASMFSNDALANGTSGLLGFGAEHALQYSTLNMTDASYLEAFKVRSANGTDVHFMKRCGNYMYVCQP